MKGGTRKLKSIDFENSYKQNFGIEVRIYSVKFSYTIDPLLPDLGGIKKQIYIGEAQLYKDPNNGEWKIQKLSLNQDEQSDLLKIIMEPKKKTDYEIYDSLAYVFYMSNMPDSALFYWSKGLKINPNFHQAYSNRGTVLSNSFQRYDEALHDFNKAIELNSKGDYYLNRSITYFKMGNIELAKKDALEAKRLGTKISEAYAIALKIN